MKPEDLEDVGCVSVIQAETTEYQDWTATRKYMNLGTRHTITTVKGEQKKISAN